MYKIAVIGSGQLGSRHLQGIKTSNLELSIEVVDSNPESLKIAENRYSEIKDNNFNKNITFLSSIDKLSKELDLVIIATSSAPRFTITKELITKKNVKNIVFEKVLFQNEDHYQIVNNLLSNNGIKAWVNCPRRMYDYYNTIKEELINEDKIIFNVSGGDWGLGCNSIHFIDIISFLTGQQKIVLITESLNKKVSSSKRPGYAEFYGTLSGFTDRGDVLTFVSQYKSIATPIISIITQNKKFIIDESNSILSCFTNNEWNSNKIFVPLQSQLTGTLVEDILLNKNVLLTKYIESMSLHLPFISSLLYFYNKMTGSNSLYCPIT